MGDLTKNISRHELRCNCGRGCGYDRMDIETIEVLQECCDHFAKMLGITKVLLSIHSASRCPEYNRSPAVGSNDNSQHVRSGAIDFSIVQASPDAVYEYLDNKYPDKYGIGKYNSFTHIDTRSTGPARW